MTSKLKNLRWITHTKELIDITPDQNKQSTISGQKYSLPSNELTYESENDDVDVGVYEPYPNIDLPIPITTIKGENPDHTSHLDFVLNQPSDFGSVSYSSLINQEDPIINNFEPYIESTQLDIEGQFDALLDYYTSVSDTEEELLHLLNQSSIAKDEVNKNHLNQGSFRNPEQEEPLDFSSTRATTPDTTIAHYYTITGNN